MIDRFFGQAEKLNWSAIARHLLFCLSFSLYGKDAGFFKYYCDYWRDYDRLKIKEKV